MAVPTFRGAPGYGLGQGPPPNRLAFANARQPSSSAVPQQTPLQSPPFGGQRQSQAFPFGAAALNSLGSPTAAEANLDPSDFPALGSNASNASSLSNAPALLSYATQAGNAVPPSPAPAAGGLNGGLLPTNAGSGPLSPPAVGGPTNFPSNDEFPALGGAFAEGGPMSVQQQQVASLHRANLLGNINGINSPQRSASATQQSFAELEKQRHQQQQPWAATPAAQQPPFPSAFGLNGDLNQAGLGSPTDSAAAARRAVVGAGPSPDPTAASLPAGSTGLGSSEPPIGGTPQTPAQQVLFSPADRYGLLGLLHLIKSQDNDIGMLALGADLTNLGLDLGANEHLYSNFITPWTDGKAASLNQIEPEFHLPACYNVQPPPAQTKIGNFSDETLFFIFYSQPRDVMQEMAAHELYKHNWRYHKELRLWLTKEAGTEPTQKTPTYERGSYIFFDPTSWSRVQKDFVLMFDALERRP